MPEAQSCLRPMPARAAVAVPRGSEEHLRRSPARQSRRLAGARGRGAAAGAAVPAPAAVAPWQRGRAGQVEAPGVLARARRGAGAQVPQLAPL